LVRLANDAPIRDAKPRAPLAALAIAAAAEVWLNEPTPAELGGAISELTGGPGAAAGSEAVAEPLRLEYAGAGPGAAAGAAGTVCLLLTGSGGAVGTVCLLLTGSGEAVVGVAPPASLD
jgi:hypothetical protein